MIVQSHDEHLFQMLLNDLELDFNFDPEKPTILIHERYIFTSSNQGLRVVICDTREEQSVFLRTALCQFSEIGSAVLMEKLQDDLAERSSV